MKRLFFIFFTLLIQSATLAHAYEIYDDTSYLECGSESDTSTRSLKLHYLYWPDAYAVGFFADYSVPGKTVTNTQKITTQSCIINELATRGENIVMQDLRQTCAVVVIPSHKTSATGTALFQVQFNQETPLENCSFTTPKEELLKAFGP